MLSTELPTDYHHNSIIKVSICWCVWKLREGFLGRLSPKTLKWVPVYTSVTFHIIGWHRDRSAPCLYTVTGWGVMSCVCGMVFLCSSTLVKVPLVQAGTVAIWPQMLKRDVNVKHKQTNKHEMYSKDMTKPSYMIQLIGDFTQQNISHTMILTYIILN